MGGHDVRFHRSGTKVLHHPLVGDLTLSYEVLELSADAGLELSNDSAAPGSETERALAELAGWSSAREEFASVEVLEER